MVKHYHAKYLRVCAWCSRYIDVAVGQYTGDTHGICKDCFREAASSVKSLQVSIEGILASVYINENPQEFVSSTVDAA